VEPRDWIFAIAVLSISTTLVVFVVQWWRNRGE